MVSPIANSSGRAFSIAPTRKRVRKGAVGREAERAKKDI